jgi:hypothetical protein
VVIIGLSVVSFIRSINEKQLSERHNYSLQAFYEAEAGLAYAYAEAVRNGFEWYTHENKNTPITSDHYITSGSTVHFQYPIPLNSNLNPSINENGNYQLAGWNFQVKSYPERDDKGNFTGVMVVLSQATVNGCTRTIEFRLGQASAYQYFFFFPESHTFETATFDGRNFGGIHVNGDILFTGNPQFHFLTALTAGSVTPGEGYILRPLKTYRNWGQNTWLQGFYDGRYNSKSGTKDYYTTPVNVQTMTWWTNNNDITWHMWDTITNHFQTGETIFRTGEIGISEKDTTLAYYLDGSDAYWKFDKYVGDPGDDNDKLPFGYRIKQDNLKDLAIYEEAGHAGKYRLLSNKAWKKIEVIINGVSVGSLQEQEAFKTAYTAEKQGKSVNWSKFWDKWKKNHQNDYTEYETNFTAGTHWERRFYLAAYDDDWKEPNKALNPGTPYGVNMEWWEDLEYGTDRNTLIDDMAPAQVVNNSTGEALERYFLNTKEQVSAWTNWLNNNALDEYGENKTLVQDKSQGGKYVDTSDIIFRQSDYDSTIKKKAKNGGIYIGLNDTGTSFINPLDGCATAEKQFYNARHPARKGKKYKPSNILEIDVNDLKKCVGEDFNGIVYVDLEGYSWNNVGDSYDANADGVMLVNGERLPDGGLSIVTPNNVYIKGNYNLDPQGEAERFRTPDDEGVIERVIEKKDHINDDSDLSWQPAEIITARAVYTLSEDFPEPQKMPLVSSHEYQGRDESYGYTDVDIIDHVYWGTPDAEWMPKTKEGDCSKTINDWFKYSGVSRPARWTESWIEANWGPWQWNDPTVFSFDIDGDTKFILRKDLKNDLYNMINNKYNKAFKYKKKRSDEYYLANEVKRTHIYNTAIVTPYSTDTYTLENWKDNTQRIINGAFIQLPDTYKYTIPEDAYEAWRRYTEPTETFNYETRYGRDTDPRNRPPANLTFGIVSSWRELSNKNF